jgi:Tol biopolymer transport system component
MKKAIFFLMLLLVFFSTVEALASSSYLFYVKNDGSAGTWTNLNIYRSDADGTNPVQLTSGAGVNVLPRVNATQTKLVFLSNRSGKYQVYTMGIDGSGVKQLTTSGVSGGQNNGGPGGVCWTPDGKILYINATKISRMNDDGTGVTEIATAPIDNWSDIRCSPTGNKIAAQTQGGWGYTLSIYIMNMDGSGMTKLVPDDPGGQSLGSFSKDGLTLYYGYDVSGHEESSGLNLDHQIYSIKIDGTAKTKISVNKPSGYNDIRPVVAGSKIYFNYEQAINNAPASEVWRMNLDGSQREQVISGVYAYYPEIVEAVPTSVSENSGQPRGFVLSQNYPNPFNPTTIISYIVPHQAHVTLEIYDGLGRQVTTLVNEIQSPGPRSIMWNGEAASGRRVASGVYYYRLNAGSFVETKKMILLK